MNHINSFGRSTGYGWANLLNRKVLRRKL